jgi:hypothetical protein
LGRRTKTPPDESQTEFIFSISLCAATLESADALVREGIGLDVSLRAHALTLAAAQKFLATLARNPGLAGPLTDALVGSLVMQTMTRAEQTAATVLDVLPAAGEA